MIMPLLCRRPATNSARVDPPVPPMPPISMTVQDDEQEAESA